MEQVAARGGIGCAIGRQAAGLRQERVGDERAQQCPKAHKEMENLEGERIGGGEGMAQALHDPHCGSSRGWEAGGVRSGAPVPTFLPEITW